MKRLQWSGFFIGLVVLVAMLATLLVGPAAAAPGSIDPDAAKDLAAARQATAKYHDVEAAVADGYAQTTGCVSHPVFGTQGIHYLKDALLDNFVTPTEPEILVYIPTGADKLRLVAVEYAVPEGLVPPIPSLFGHEFHQPPSIPLFVLHAWVWQANPNGNFEDWNPNLSCPEP